MVRVDEAWATVWGTVRGNNQTQPYTKITKTKLYQQGKQARHQGVIAPAGFVRRLQFLIRSVEEERRHSTGEGGDRRDDADCSSQEEGAISPCGNYRKEGESIPGLRERVCFDGRLCGSSNVLYRSVRLREAWSEAQLPHLANSTRPNIHDPHFSSPSLPPCIAYPISISLLCASFRRLIHASPKN